jgi:Putative metallopeptidase
VKFPVSAIALLLILLGPSPGKAVAQGTTAPENPQVEISYRPPQKREYQPMYNRLKERKVLEELRQFLAPLRLPKKLTVQIDQCGAQRRPYKDGVATICYELIEQIERVATRLSADSRTSAVAGAFVQATMYEIAQAILDILDFPVWGRAGDAADRLSAFVMLSFDEELAIRTITATATFFDASKKTWTGSAFADVNSPEEQRFYNYLCIAYGGEPISFRFLVTAGQNEDPILPIPRARRCRGEYEQVRKAFNLRIMPFVDPQMLVAVRSREWLLPKDVK